MTARGLIAAIPTLVLAACGTGPTELEPCSPRPMSIVGTQGDTVTMSTGLRYIELLEGTGPAVEWCQRVEIHYEAFLLDGTRLESTRDANVTVVFRPGADLLIPGVEQGTVGIRQGGLRRLIVPPELGFGSQPLVDASGNVIVPANSTLIYEIEVVGIG